MDKSDVILTESGLIAGITTFIGLSLLILTIYFIYMCYRYLATGIERNKEELKLIHALQHELEYKRTKHYDAELSYYETQTKLARKELAEK